MPEGNGSQPTILLVDDFEDSRALLALHLRQEGYGVVEASNGVEAVGAARRARPDLVLMDLGMPGMDGLSAACRLRELPQMRDVPVVALTAFGGEGHRAAARAAGCDDFLTKPFQPEELLRAVRRQLAEGRREPAAGARTIDSAGMGREQLLEAIDEILSPRP